MKLAKSALIFSAFAAASPALAHSGHSSAGHVHWEFLAAGLALAVACAVFILRRRSR